jgi:hypothetical protein
LGGVCRTLRFGFVLVSDCIEIIGGRVFAVDECHRAIGFEFVIAGRDARGDRHRDRLIGVRTVGEVGIDRNVHRFADQGGDINITACCDALSRAGCGASHRRGQKGLHDTRGCRYRGSRRTQVRPFGGGHTDGEHPCRTGNVTGRGARRDPTRHGFESQRCRRHLSPARPLVVGRVG